MFFVCIVGESSRMKTKALAKLANSFIKSNLQNQCDRKQYCFAYTSENISLGWKWLALIVFTVSVIQLPHKSSVQYGFDVPKCYQIDSISLIKVPNLLLFSCPFKMFTKY